jgi:hypothetical protein
MPRQPRHCWLHEQLGHPTHGGGPFLSELPSPLLPPISAHRRRRGPYTAAGTIMRALAPDAAARFPDVVTGHAVEVVTVAPELRSLLDPGQAIRSATSPDQDMTESFSLQLFSPQRTLRLAHGLSEFLRDYTLAACGGPTSLMIRDIAEADETDQELFAVLLRRLDPGLVTLVLVTEAARIGAPLSAPLADALNRFAEARVLSGTEGNGRPPTGLICSASLPATRRAELAAAYVASDCLATDPAAFMAYQAMPDAMRRQLHDRRAEELVQVGEYSLRLGAIAYHRERGSEPASGIAALREALQHCIGLGFFEAAVDMGNRGRTLASWQAEPGARYWFTTKLATALIALARPDEAEPLYEEVRQNSTDPKMHMSTAYATAILLTRHYSETHPRHDHHRARGWLNEAAALAALLPESPRLARQRVFNKVGMAVL